MQTIKGNNDNNNNNNNSMALVRKPILRLSDHTVQILYLSEFKICFSFMPGNLKKNRVLINF
jgi:hypothetical protein